MRSISKKYLIIFGMWYFFISQVWSQDITTPPPREILIEADYIAYDSEKNIIIVVGNVVAKINREIKINCDNMQVSVNERKVLAQGNITIVNINMIENKIKGIANGIDKLTNTSVYRILKVCGGVSPACSPLYRENVDYIPMLDPPGINWSPTQGAMEPPTGATYNVTVENKDITSLQGDDLFYDIQLSIGRLIRVEPFLSKIYFQGIDLKIISSILGEKQEDYRTDLEKSSLVLVCKKILFIFEDKMEAYQVSVWSKGIKVLSVPYYSTDFEIEFPDIPIAVRKIDYDSKDRLRSNLVLNYSKHKKYIGKMNFEYQQRKETKKDVWKTHLNQQFILGGQKMGTVLVNNVGERDYSISVNYNHYLGTNFQINPTISYARKSSKSGGIFLNRRFLQSNFSASYNETESLISKDKTTTVNLKWQKYPKFIEKTKLSYSTDVGWDYTESKNKTNSRITTNLNLLRSGLYLLPKLYLDLNTSLSQVMSEEEGSSSFRTSATSHYLRERKWGRAVISVGYFVSSSRQEYLNYSSSSRTVSINTSFSRKTKWTARAGTGYDARSKKWSDAISPNLDVKINRLLRTNIAGSYDHKEDEFQNASVSIFYNLLGEKDPRYLQGYFSWRKSPKPKSYYYITFNSSI